jgi:hypothetical protein
MRLGGRKSGGVVGKSGGRTVLRSMRLESCCIAGAGEFHLHGCNACVFFLHVHVVLKYHVRTRYTLTYGKHVCDASLMHVLCLLLFILGTIYTKRTPLVKQFRQMHRTHVHMIHAQYTKKRRMHVSTMYIPPLLATLLHQSSSPRAEFCDE